MENIKRELYMLNTFLSNQNYFNMNVGKIKKIIRDINKKNINNCVSINELIYNLKMAINRKDNVLTSYFYFKSYFDNFYYIYVHKC